MNQYPESNRVMRYMPNHDARDLCENAAQTFSLLMKPDISLQHERRRRVPPSERKSKRLNSASLVSGLKRDFSKLG